MKRRQKAYSQMTTAELREATREFDKEIKRFPPGRALTAAQRQTLRRARERGRPRVGEGAAHVQITMERALLRDVDEVARANGVTRSQFIAQSVRRHLEKAG